MISRGARSPIGFRWPHCSCRFRLARSGKAGYAGQCCTQRSGRSTGFAVFLVFYLLGGMGGGDVKLMAGFGALLGFHQLIAAALWTAGVGGSIIAAGVLGVRALRRALEGRLRQQHRNRARIRFPTLRRLRWACGCRWHPKICSGWRAQGPSGSEQKNRGEQVWIADF